MAKAPLGQQVPLCGQAVRAMCVLCHGPRVAMWELQRKAMVLAEAVLEVSWLLWGAPGKLMVPA